MSSGIHQLRPAQSEMKKILMQTQNLNLERMELAHKYNLNTFGIAKNLHEISEGQYAELSLGMSFRDFVATMRDENGTPRTLAWAKGLLHSYRKITHHPELLRILERQEPLDAAGFVTFSAAYYTAKLAEEENIRANTTRAMNNDGVPGTEWEAEKALRLTRYYYDWGTRSVRTIKDRIREVRQDKVDEKTPTAWPFHGGRIDPDVKKRYDDALERILTLEGSGRSIEGLTYVQEIETLTETVSDILDAIDEAARGNTAPLNGLIEQAFGETNV